MKSNEQVEVSVEPVINSVVEKETTVAPVAHVDRSNEALHVIKNHAITAMGVGILPTPGLDLIALTAVQLNLLRKLGNLYGQSFSEEAGKKFIGALVGGYLPLAVVAPVASILKFIPGVGVAAGVLAQSVSAGASTYAIGKIFSQHFETGGSFLNFEPAKVQAKFREQVQEGKDFIKKRTSSKTETA